MDGIAFIEIRITGSTGNINLSLNIRKTVSIPIPENAESLLSYRKKAK